MSCSAFITFRFAVFLSFASIVGILFIFFDDGASIIPAVLVMVALSVLLWVAWWKQVKPRIDKPAARKPAPEIITTPLVGSDHPAKQAVIKTLDRSACFWLVLDTESQGHTIKAITMEGKTVGYLPDSVSSALSLTATDQILSRLVRFEENAIGNTSLLIAFEKPS